MERVEPVLRHVGVERAQVDRDERIHGLEDRAVFVVAVRPADLQRHLGVAREDVAVHLLHRRHLHEVDVGMEVVQVRHQIAEGVADLAVGLDRAGQHFLADADLLGVVAHRHPEAKDVGAALLDDVLRLDRVAERLRHLAAVFRHDEAVRQHLAERCAAARAQPDEQRALEPAAVLVAAFEVDVRRPGQLGSHRQHRLMARPRIEPDVEDVHLALEAGIAAGRTGQALRHELRRSAARTRRRRRTARTLRPPSRRSPAR